MLWMAIGALCVNAQDSKVVNLQLETRMDYQREYLDGDAVLPNSGFKGKYLNVMLNGTIDEHWSYSFRQRLNKTHADATFFDATDWVHITYTPNDNWSFNAGKQVVGIGGYEYDRAPMDFYFGSEYWYSMACYQWGVSAKYNLGTESDDVLNLQITQSPFRDYDFNPLPGLDNVLKYPSMLSYNLMWTGSYGCLDILHSVNMLEYLPGKFVNFIALGHQLYMGYFTLQLDWMNRAALNDFGFDDFSVMADLSWSASEKLNVFGKVTYDVNKDNAADLCVSPDTELTRVGAGVEYFPIEGSRNVRLHGTYSYAWGENGNPAGTVWNNHSFVSLGVTWKMDILKR